MSLNSFFQKLVPTDLKFYPMFENMAELIVKASSSQLLIFEHDDPVKQKDLFKLIKELENKADEVVQTIFDELDKSFVPPFDREDMNVLTTSLDEVINGINGVAQRVRLYRPKEIPSEFKDFAKLISKGCEQINISVKELHDLKKPAKILKACKKINDLEKEADELYHSTISTIFKKEKDAIELIKQKEMLENLEKTADRIKSVSNILKIIILKMS
ncbi:MAG: DUF47 family protein [Bacteroidales bacterium]|nr:DUF47 family protein [Bacteroidales bacterium]MCB9012692.1 DUF47 family protein [Bacteroidales bacterium]